MKLKCVKMGVGLDSAVFFWEEGPEKQRNKVVKSLKLGECFDVEDMTGHEIISKYKECFEVVSYGQKGATSPRTAVVKEERTKDGA